MSGEERRNAIIELLKKSGKPVPGTELAKALQVSRQVIVQDIALLRTGKVDITSTNRGYVLPKEEQDVCSRIFKCCHDDAHTEAELNCIVDEGGVVKNVFVNHKAYGHIEATLNIRSRRDVKDFLGTIKSGKSALLKNVTSDYHYHEVEAESEVILDCVETELRGLGFLVEKA